MKKLIFFKDLLDKTLYSFAAKIETKISHPQEVIRAINDDFDLLILRQGAIGYGCMKKGCALNEEIIDLVSVKEGGEPFLTSLDFISKIRPVYEIISLSFSVLFRLDYSNLIEITRPTVRGNVPGFRSASTTSSLTLMAMSFRVVRVRR